MCVCCEGDGNAGVGYGGGVVAVSAYMGGTRGSGVFASTGDVLEMNVVSGIDGVCDMYMCLARGGVGGVGCEWVTGLVWALPILEEHGKSGICVLCFGCGGVGGVGGECVGGLGQGLGGCCGVMSVCAVSLDSLC